MRFDITWDGCKDYCDDGQYVEFAEVERLRAELEDWKGRAHGEAASRVALQGQIHELITKLAAANDESERLRASVAAYESAEQRMSGELSDALEALAAANAEIERLRAELDEERCERVQLEETDNSQLIAANALLDGWSRGGDSMHMLAVLRRTRAHLAGQTAAPNVGGIDWERCFRELQVKAIDDLHEATRRTAAANAEVERLRALCTLRDATERENAKLTTEIERLRAELATFERLHEAHCEADVRLCDNLSAANALLDRAYVELDCIDAVDASLRDDIGTHLAGQTAAAPIVARQRYPPSAADINALQDPVRRWVHDLETQADPSGTVREAAAQRENAEALAVRVRELQMSTAAEQRVLDAMGSVSMTTLKMRERLNDCHLADACEAELARREAK